MEVSIIMDTRYKEILSTGYEMYRTINQLLGLSMCTNIKLPAYIDAMNKTKASIDILSNILSTTKFENDDNSKLTGLYLYLNSGLIALQRKVIDDMVINRSDESMTVSHVTDLFKGTTKRDTMQNIINSMYKESGLISSGPEKYDELHDGFEYNNYYYISSKCFLNRYNSYTGNHYSIRKFLSILSELNLIKSDEYGGTIHNTHHCIIKSVPWIKSKRFVIYYPN